MLLAGDGGSGVISPSRADLLLTPIFSGAQLPSCSCPVPSWQPRSRVLADTQFSRLQQCGAGLGWDHRLPDWDFTFTLRHRSSDPGPGCLNTADLPPPLRTLRTSSSFIFAGIPRQFLCRVADYRAGLEFYALKWENEKGRAETADCVTAG